MRRCRPVSSLLLVLPMLLVCIGETGLWGQTPAQYHGSIAGELREEPGGAPANHVSVAVEGTALYTTTGSDGAFRFQDLPPGSYRLIITSDHYEPQFVDEIVVASGRVTALALVVHPRTILTLDPVKSAEGRIQPFIEAPAAFSVISAEQIASRNLHSLDRALVYVPGVQMMGAQASIHGASGFAPGGGSRVALLVDGVPQNNADDGGIRYDILPMSAISQVEVVHGPASALYGDGAISGVVNVITRLPEQGFHMGVNLSGGMYDDPGVSRWKWWGLDMRRFNGAEAIVSGKSGPVGAILSGAYHLDQGYRQFDDVERYNLFGRFHWTLDRLGQFRLTAFSSQSNHGGYRSWRNADSALYASTTESATPRINSSSTSAIAEISRAGDDDFSFLARGGFHLTAIEDARPQDHPLKLQSTAGSYFAETQINSAFNRMIHFTYGGILRLDDISSRNYGSPVTRSIALYGQMEFSNLEDITAVIQARFDRIDEPRYAVGESHLSPRVGITYRPSDETSLRVVLGRGFRMPTVAERYGSGVVGGITVAQSLHLNPEQNWHGEMGALQEFRMQELRLAVDMGLYVDEYFSLIEGVINPSDGVVTYQNVTRARVLGGDFGLRGEIPPLSLGFSADISPIVARDLKQNLLLPSRSNTIGHLRISWDPVPFSIALDYRYSARIDSIDSLLGRLIASADRRDATHIVDLQLACDLSRTTSVPLAFRVEGRNLLQYYAVDGVGNLAPIRTFEAGIEMKF